MINKVLVEKSEVLSIRTMSELITETEKQYIEDRKAHSEIEEMVYFVKL